MVYNSKEVARILGLSFHSIRKYAITHKVGRKLGRDWIFTDDDVAALVGRRKKRGRPLSTT